MNQAGFLLQFHKIMVDSNVISLVLGRPVECTQPIQASATSLKFMEAFKMKILSHET